ncbi:hypothetical protein DINM_003214 [Dirofilaria immitis]|nr:hypothetical protein [Dirofilaria immitis]
MLKVPHLIESIKLSNTEPDLSRSILSLLAQRLAKISGPWDQHSLRPPPVVTNRNKRTNKLNIQTNHSTKSNKQTRQVASALDIFGKSLFKQRSCTSVKADCDSEKIAGGTTTLQKMIERMIATRSFRKSRISSEGKIFPLSVTNGTNCSNKSVEEVALVPAFQSQP